MVKHGDLGVSDVKIVTLQVGNPVETVGATWPHRFGSIPGVIIHGRFDMSGPLITAWRLSQQWTTYQLQILGDAGHGGGDTFVPAVVAALDT